MSLLEKSITTNSAQKVEKSKIQEKNQNQNTNVEEKKFWFA